MRAMGTPEGAELRLALAMRGGVSLAVWIGGASAEIDALRRAADEKEGFWWELLQASPYSRVVVDVMAGASAGGLNGVLFASSMRHGFRMDGLLDTWRRVAGVGTLTREGPPWISMFNGDAKFLDVIRDTLAELVADGPGPAAGADGAEDPTASYVDLQLSATLVEPVDAATISPGDEKLRRGRSSARFHFRHDPMALPPRHDLEAGAVPRLALAARATASFPMAFEAAVVRSTRPPSFAARPLRTTSTPLGIGDLQAALHQLSDDERDARLTELRLPDCRGVFSESRGAAKAPAAPFHHDDFVVADGGIVDNIPLGKALDAIRDAPADGPTRRVLVYLHPTGPSGIAGHTHVVSDEGLDEAEVRRRGPLAVAAGLVASRLQGESIDDDLEQLEELNRSIRLAAAMRQSLLQELHGSSVGPVELAGQRLDAYLVQRGGSDAMDVHRLLRDPLGTLGEDPFPLAPDAGPAMHPDDRWRSPLACWTPEQRIELDVRLRTVFGARLTQVVSASIAAPGGLHLRVLKGGFGPLQRVIGHLLELAREGEKLDMGQPDRHGIGGCKRRLYRLASLVRALDRDRQLGWVAAAGRVVADTAVDDWLTTTSTRLNALLRLDPAVASTLCDPDADTAEFEAAYDAVFAASAAGLQSIADGAPATEPPEGWTDVRDVIVEKLAGMVDDLLSHLPAPTDGVEERSGAEVTQRILLTDAPIAERLAALEILLHDEHLVGDSATGEISFVRMSAAAPVIDADRFVQLHRHSEALDPRFTDIDHLVPDVKLAGNELSNFSAFLDPRWRANDWTWGRMDAVSTLVDLLLGEDRFDTRRVQANEVDQIPGEAQMARQLAAVGPMPMPDERRAAARRALIARRQAEILAEAATEGLPADPADWTAGLETLVHPGSDAIRTQVGGVASVAARVVGVALPRRVPRITGQLDGLASWLARRIATPKGGLPPLPAPVGAEPPTATPSSARGTGVLVAVLSVVAATVAAGLVWAVADHALSLAIGLVVGLLVALVPGAALLWLAVQRPHDGDPPVLSPRSVVVGVLIGALLCLGLAAVGAAAWDAVT